MTLTHTKKKMPAAPVGFDLVAAAERVDQQIQRADRAVGVAINEAVTVGLMLLEVREHLDGNGHSNQHTPAELQFQKFVEEAGERNGVGRATLYRWIGAAQGTRRGALENAAIDVEALSVPLSVVLTAPEEELPEEAREVRQLLFRFMAEKSSLKECAAAGVVVDGDDASRITRAHNGKSKGGTRGEDRKDFPKFIKGKLAHINTHLEHWDAFTAGQKEETILAWAQFWEGCPKAVIELVVKAAKKEMGSR
jgi:hypothetical protein